MPQDVDIVMTHNRRRSHRPVRLQRYAPDDGTDYVSHIYSRSYTTREWEWCWNRGGLASGRSRDHWGPDDQWVFAVSFLDGTQGTIALARINEALEALGARLDMRGDET